MSRRGLIVRTLLLIQGSLILGVFLLTLSAFYLLDLQPTTRRTELIRYLVYGAIYLAFLNGLTFWRLRPILLLLKTWQRGQVAGEALLLRAQGQALTLPTYLFVAFMCLAFAMALIAIYVDVTVLHYQLTHDLGNAALAIVFALGIGFVISAGLRILLRPVLRQIPLIPLPAWGRFSMAARMTLAVMLVGLVTLTFADAFAHSYLLQALDERISQERARWLEETVSLSTLPLTKTQHKDAEKGAGIEGLLDRGTQLARAGEELFILDRQGQYVGRQPTRHVLLPGELQVLARQQSPFAYKRDFALLRAIAMPIGQDTVLCLAYESEASTSPIFTKMLRVLAAFSAGALAFALAVGLVTSLDLSRAVQNVADRLAELSSVGADAQRGDEFVAESVVTADTSPIAQTSLDEIGDLVQAFNRVQQRLHAYTERLQESVVVLHGASEERQRLLDTMVMLTVPVIPLAEGLVLIPLSGYFDQQRAAIIRPHLLQGIAAARARTAIVDLTAVAGVSEALVDCLPRALRAVTLMGCQVILTGASADVAWALTQAEAGLETLPAVQLCRDLEDGLAYAYTAAKQHNRSSEK